MRTFTIADAHEYVERVRWQFARSMPWCPHEYTVRQWDDDEDSFNAFVLLIRNEGTLTYWPTKGRRREVKPELALDGWGYWTVGDPIGICQVINRAQLPAGAEIPDEEMEQARWMDSQRGRRVRLIAHGPGAKRRPRPGRIPSADTIDELPPGIGGTVMMLDTLGQIHVRWDDRSRTTLREGVDEWVWET